MPEKFEPTKFNSDEKLPEDKKSQSKPIEGGSGDKNTIENQEGVQEETEKHVNENIALEKKEEKEISKEEIKNKIERLLNDAKNITSDEEEDEREYTERMRMENINDYREYINVVAGITDQIDKEMENKGGIDFFREGFWNDLYSIEKKLSPNKPLRELLREKREFTPSLAIAQYTYWRELCLFDIFNYLTGRGVSKSPTHPI